MEPDCKNSLTNFDESLKIGNSLFQCTYLSGQTIAFFDFEQTIAYLYIKRIGLSLSNLNSNWRRFDN